MASIVVGTTVNGGGVSLNNSETIVVPKYEGVDPLLPAAKVGTLTRSDANTGTLTMAAGHGFTTGQRLDVFWLDPTTGQQKCQHKCTVGSVSGNAVPIDLGVGDDLPAAANTPVTAQVPGEYGFEFDETKMIVFAVGGGGNGGGAAGKVVVEDSGGTVLFDRTLGANGAGFTWLIGGGTNPLADTPAKVFLSNGSSAVTNRVTAFAGLSS
jgi:hypothetical protein